MMNRQLRRAQKKQDEKSDKDKQRRRAVRRSRIQSLRAQRSKRGDGAAKRGERGGNSGGGSRPRARNPGRFSGVLLIATVFFIALNAAVPRPEVEAGGGFLSSPEAFSIIGALYYGLFGYFAVLWLNRRQLTRPLMLALVSGVMLALGGEAARFIQGDYAPDLLFLLLIPPALVIGTFGGRWVHNQA
jgi:hypothetical protein